MRSCVMMHQEENVLNRPKQNFIKKNENQSTNQKYRFCSTSSNKLSAQKTKKGPGKIISQVIPKQPRHGCNRRQ